MRSIPACLLAVAFLTLTGCSSPGVRAGSAAAPILNAAAAAGPSGIAAPSGSGAAASCPDVVLTPGTIHGSPDGTDACVYRGIQYATAERWQAPRVQLAQSGGNPGNQFGPVCPQTVGGSPVGKEQCLYLNIWRRTGTVPSDRKQVMVYIHGGAFISGSGGSESGINLFNGSHFAGFRDVVLVTFNYRLGALGSLFASGLGNGNYGLLDQEAALEWVQSNIHLFGGSPDRVMVFGESAGAMSVGLHLMSTPRAQSRSWLFKTALMESNPLGLPYKSLSDAQTVGSAFQGALAGQSVPDILSAQGAVSQYMALTGDLSEMLAWAPAVDGKTVLTEPMAGKLPMPTVLGTNRDEGTLFAYGAYNEDADLFSDDSYKARLTAMFGAANAASVQAKAAYKPTGAPEKNAGQLANVINDYLFTCANADLASRTASPEMGAFLYQFNRVPTYNLVATLVPQCAGKVCHAAELPFVFHDDDFLAPGGERSLATTISAGWLLLAKFYTPGWPAYGAGASGNYFDFNLDSAPKNNQAILSASNCSFWKSVGYGAASTPPARMLRTMN